MLTEAVEVPIYRGSLKRRPFWLVRAFLASAMTHPFVAVVFPWLFSHVMEPVYFVPGHTVLSVGLVMRASLFAVVAESFAVLVEWRWLLLSGGHNPFRYAVVANLASSTLGLVLTLTTGWP